MTHASHWDLLLGLQHTVAQSEGCPRESLAQTQGRISIIGAQPAHEGCEH